MKFLFASDSFKGTISSDETAKMLTVAAKNVFGDVECIALPMADGGEGTVDAVIKAVGGEKIQIEAHDPLWKVRKVSYGKLSAERAIIEMATISGLPLVTSNERNPLYTTTYGTGELIKDALEKGFTDIYIAIGGSATNDGGMGCMQALGVRFLDEKGNELQGEGCNLKKIDSIDTSNLDRRIFNTRFTVMCDVNNPLCGQDGATYTFAAQKGATPEIQDELERGMCHYRDKIEEQWGINPDEIAGTGAAGGLGAALLVFMKAILMSGIETVLKLTDFDNIVKDVNLVVTGEGRTDWQSCHGKVLQGVGTHCAKFNVPAVALVGSIGDGAEEIFNYGICSLMAAVSSPMPLEQALSHAKEYYMAAAMRMFRMIKAGTLLQKSRI